MRCQPSDRFILLKIFLRGMAEYVYTIFALLPFMVSLVSLALYVVVFKSLKAPQRFLVVFIVTCVILFFFSGWFIVSGGHIPSWADAVLLFSALAAYPLFYCYTYLLTRARLTWQRILFAIIPASILSFWAYATDWSRITFHICKIVFAAEIVQVAIVGIRDIRSFDNKVKNFYADTEGKTLKSASVLLVCIAVIAALSLLSTLTARNFFRVSLIMSVHSVVLSSLLFGIFYMGYNIRYYAKDFEDDLSSDASSALAEQEDAALEARISSALESGKLYLVPGLKISDVAEAVGSNRTYVSKAINNVAGMSFSDYVNSRRIGYAKKLLENSGVNDEKSIAGVASDSGFASFPSFYRSFTKFVGMSPSAWIKRSAH